MNIKDNIKKMAAKINKIWKKCNKTIIIVFIIILLLSFVIIIVRVNKNKLPFDKIESVKLEDVETLYKNINAVSCIDGLYLGIEEGKEIKANELDNVVLLNYLFRFLERNELLDDKINESIITKNAEILFYGVNESIFNDINNFQYGDYLYTIKKNQITRKKKECSSDDVYVSRLFGYTNNEQELSMDVDIGKLVDGILYDMEGNKLGNYDGEEIKLIGLFSGAPFYRYNYVKINGTYKLKSVILVSRDLD